MTRLKKKYLLVLLYAGLSILMVLVINTKGIIWGGDDMVYHVGRLISLKSSFLHGVVLPNISTSNFGMIGYGINLFYPWITLSPIALFLSLIHNPILAYYCGIGFYMFVSFLISHYAMKKFSNSEKQAIIFSLIYGLANYRLIDVFSRADLAEYIATVFLPLAFLGFYETFFRDYHKWPLLAAGMSLLLLTHVLTTVIVAFFFIIILLLFWWMSQNYLARLKATLAAIVTSVLASAIFLGPFLSEILYQKYQQPSPYVLKGKDTAKLLLSGLYNNSARSIDGNIYNIGIVLTIALVLGLIFFKSFSRRYKAIYLLSILTMLMVTQLFPWQIFQNTPLDVIQFPFRFLLIATLLISVVATKLFTNLFAKQHAGLVIGLLTVLLMSLWYVSVNSALKTKYLTANDQIVTAKSIDGKSIYEGYYEQYSPAKSQADMKDIEGHFGYLNDEKILMAPQADGKFIKFNFKNVHKGTVIDLPIIKYQHSFVRVNGKVGPSYSSKRGTVQFKVGKDYRNLVIQTGYHTGFIAWFSLFISLITWLWLLLEIIYKY